MNITSRVKSMFRRKINFDEFGSAVAKHMQDPQVLEGRRTIEDFWQGKVKEFYAFLESNPDYQRMQELWLALENLGEVKSIRDIDQEKLELLLGSFSVKTEAERAVLNQRVDVSNKEIAKYNSQMDLERERESVEERFSDEFTVGGIVLSNPHIADNSRYFDLERTDLFRSEILDRAIRTKFEKFSNFIGLPYIESKECEQVILIAKSLREKQRAQLTETLMKYLGKDFRAIYLCPAWAPADLKMREQGAWTYLDRMDLLKEGENVSHFYETNKRTRFVQHDLNNPNLPLHNSSFDFVYYTLDYAGKGVTSKAAEKLVKPRGVVMTLSVENPRDHTRLSQLGDYEFYGYQILTKE